MYLYVFTKHLQIHTKSCVSLWSRSYWRWRRERHRSVVCKWRDIVGVRKDWW